MTRKRFFCLLYILAVLSFGWFGVAWFSMQDTTLLMPGILVLALSNLAICMLTFPCGGIVLVFGTALQLVGLATPAETYVLATPLMAALGLWQWIWLFPRLYSFVRKSGPALLR